MKVLQAWSNFRVHPGSLKRAGLNILMCNLGLCGGQGLPIFADPSSLAISELIARRAGRGDLRVFYADKVIEATYGEHEMFGEDRLRKVNAAHGCACAPALPRAIVDAVARFVCPAEVGG